MTPDLIRKLHECCPCRNTRYYDGAPCDAEIHSLLDELEKDYRITERLMEFWAKQLKNVLFQMENRNK
jgi:hypothetical protein